MAKITDFGISRSIISEDKIENSLTLGVGTPHYMAPEQFYKKKFGFNEEVSARTDYWSIGVIAYWMGKGVVPFGAGSKEYEIIWEEIVNRKPDWAGMPSPYLEIARACLVKEASRRVADAAGLLACFNKIPDHRSFERPEGNGGEKERTVVTPKLGEEATPVSKEPNPPTKGKVGVIMGVLVLLTLVFSGYFFYQNHQINTLLDKAWGHYKAGEYNDAYEMYLKASDYNSGKAFYFLSLMNYYARGTERNYNKFIDYAENAMKEGFDMVAFHLGDAYQKGNGVPIDTAKAISYYQRSVNHVNELSKERDPTALNLQYLLLWEGRVVDRDTIQAMGYLKSAAELGLPAAIANLGYAFLNGTMVEKNYSLAMEWFKKGLKINEDNSLMGMGNLFYNGYGVDKNLDSAFTYYKKSAELGNVDAQSHLGYMLYNGYGTKPDKTEAFYWWRKAAEEGNTLSQNNLGWVYENENNPTEAKRWYLRAAGSGYVPSQRRVGNLYRNEFEELDSAIYWYRLAAKNEDSDAQVSLGYLFSNGTGLTQNYDSAHYWYQRAADLKNRVAINNLGWIHYDGLGFETDYNKAFDLFSEAAEMNFAISQYGLGLIYYHGNGKTTDYQTAFNWFTKAAEQDYTNAQQYLGDMHAAGTGIPQDFFKAVDWYEKAAEKGNSWSQYKLGLFYYHGLGGLEKSKSKARLWLSKSCESKTDDACERLKAWF